MWASGGASTTRPSRNVLTAAGTPSPPISPVRRERGQPLGYARREACSRVEPLGLHPPEHHVRRLATHEASGGKEILKSHLVRRDLDVEHCGDLVSLQAGDRARCEPELYSIDHEEALDAVKSRQEIEPERPPVNDCNIRRKFELALERLGHPDADPLVAQQDVAEAPPKGPLTHVSFRRVVLYPVKILLIRPDFS